jgi:hypothetical protein
MTADDIAKAAFIANARAPNLFLQRVIELLVDVDAARAKHAKLVAKVRAGRDGRDVRLALKQHNDLRWRMQNKWFDCDAGIAPHDEQTCSPDVLQLTEVAADELTRALIEMRKEMSGACAVQPLAPEPTMPVLESMLR